MILLHFTQLTAGSVCTGSRNGGSSPGRNLLERKTGIDIDGDGDAGVTGEQKHMHEEAKHARLAAEQAEKERIAAEQAERELTAAEEAEQERIAAQQVEQESIAAERTEQTSSVLEQNGEFVKQVKQVVSRIFEQSISATKFPMIKGSKSWGTYELTSLQVDRIGIGSGNLSISISDTVDVTITGASAHIDEFMYHYERTIPRVAISGTVNGSQLTNLSSRFSFVLGVDDDGNLQIGDHAGVIRASLDISSVEIQRSEMNVVDSLRSPVTPTASPSGRMAAAEQEWVDSVLLKVMKERMKEVMQREMRKMIQQNAAALTSQLLRELSQLSDGASAEVRRVAALQSSISVIRLPEPEPEPESEHAELTQHVDIVEPPILLQQKMSSIRQALQSEVTRAEAAQTALAETDPSLSAQIFEAHGEYVSRIHALEAQIVAAAAAHNQANMSTDPQSLLLQLAGIEQALAAEKTNRAAAEAALSLPRIFAETLQAATSKRVDTYMHRKTAKLTANAFEGWAEVVAFDIMHRRSTAEALASEVIAAEEAANEMHIKMSAAHGTRTSALEQQVESLAHQLALANQKLGAADVAQLSATQERLESELRKEQVAYAEFVATQEKQNAIWRDEITEAHRQQLATLQQALEAEMMAKELLVEKALSADAVEQEVKEQAQAKLDAGEVAMQQRNWQAAVDTFEDGIRQIEGHDQELSQRLRDSKAAAASHLASQTNARKAAQDKLELGRRTAESNNFSTAVALFEQGLQIIGTNSVQLTQTLRMELENAQKRLEEQEVKMVVPTVTRHTRKVDGQQYDFLESADVDSYDLLESLMAACADDSKPVDELIANMAECLTESTCMLENDCNGSTPLHALVANPKVNSRWLKAAVGAIGANAMLTQSNDHRQTTPMHLLCANSAALSPELLASSLDTMNPVAVMTETKDSQSQTPLDTLAKMLAGKQLPSASQLDIGNTARVSSWQQRISSSFIDAATVSAMDIGDARSADYDSQQLAGVKDPELMMWLSTGLPQLLQEALLKADGETTPLHQLMYYMCQTSTLGVPGVCEQWLDKVFESLDPCVLLKMHSDKESPLHTICRHDALGVGWLLTAAKKVDSQAALMSKEPENGNTVLHYLCEKTVGLTQGSFVALLETLPPNAMLMKNLDMTTPLHNLCANPALTPEFLSAVLQQLPGKERAIITPGKPSAYRCLQEATIYEQMGTGQRVSFKKTSNSRCTVDKDQVITVDEYHHGTVLYVHLADADAWAAAAAASGRPLLEALDGTPLDALLNRLCGSPASVDVDGWRHRLSSLFIQTTLANCKFEVSPHDQPAYKAACIEQIIVLAKHTGQLIHSHKFVVEHEPEPERDVGQLRQELDVLTCSELAERLQSVCTQLQLAEWLVVALKPLLREAMLTESVAHYILMADTVAVLANPQSNEAETLELRKLLRTNCENEDILRKHLIGTERKRRVRGSTWLNHQLGWSELEDPAGTTVFQRTTPLHELCKHERLNSDWLDAVLKPLPAKAMLTECRGSTETPLDHLCANTALTADWLASLLQTLPSGAAGMQESMVQALIVKQAKGLTDGPLKNMLAGKHVSSERSIWSTTASKTAAHTMHMTLASAYVFALCDSHDLPAWTKQCPQKIEKVRSSAETQFLNGEYVHARESFDMAIEMLENSPTELHDTGVEKGTIEYMEAARAAAHAMAENHRIEKWLVPMIKPHYQAKLTKRQNEDTVLHKLCMSKTHSISELATRLMSALELLPRDAMLTPGKGRRTPLQCLCERPRAQPPVSVHVGGLKPPYISPPEHWEAVSEEDDTLRVQEAFTSFGHVKHVHLRRRNRQNEDGTRLHSWAQVDFESSKSVSRAIEAQERLNLVIRVLDVDLSERSTGAMKHVASKAGMMGTRSSELTLELLVAGLRRLPASAKQIILSPENQALAQLLDSHFKAFDVTMSATDSIRCWCECYDPLVDALADERQLAQSLHKSGVRHSELGTGGWARKLVQNLPKELPSTRIVKQIMESATEQRNAEDQGDADAYMDTLRTELGNLSIFELKDRALKAGVKTDVVGHQMTLPQVPNMIMHLAQLFDSGLGPTATSLLADHGVADATYSLVAPNSDCVDYSRVYLGRRCVATAGVEELYPSYGEPQREGVDWSRHLDKANFATDNTDRVEVRPVVVTIQGAGHAQDKGLLQLLTKPNVPNSLFETDIVRIIVAHKWAAFGQDIFFQEVCVYTLMLVSFQVLVLMVATYGTDVVPDLDDKQVYAVLLLSLSAGTVFKPLLEKWLPLGPQSRISPRSSWKDKVLWHTYSGFIQDYHSKQDRGSELCGIVACDFSPLVPIVGWLFENLPGILATSLWLLLLSFYSVSTIVIQLAPIAVACYVLDVSPEGLSSLNARSVSGVAVVCVVALTGYYLLQEFHELSDADLPRNKVVNYRSRSGRGNCCAKRKYNDDGDEVFDPMAERPCCHPVKYGVCGFHRVLGLCRALSNYLQSIWNLLDLGFLSINLVVAVRTLNQSDAAVTTQIAVFNTLMLWFRAIQKLSGFDATAKYISMFFAVTTDMVSFLVMIGIFIVSNGFALSLLYPMHLHPMGSNTSATSAGPVIYAHEEVVPGQWEKHAFANGTEYWINTLNGQVISNMPTGADGGWAFTKFQQVPDAQVIGVNIQQVAI
eukprot:COSAG02_NODE_563_length_20290_cov_23.664108_13_plen_2651_part_00